LQGSLKLNTLNALMRVSLCNIEMDNMDWKDDLWGVAKHDKL
jgi:hypothetical protein